MKHEHPKCTIGPAQINNAWFQKIFIAPPRRELEIPKGRGVKDPGNSRREGGCMIKLVSRGIPEVLVNTDLSVNQAVQKSFLTN